MIIVVISTLSPDHYFVISRVNKHWPVRCVIQPVWRYGSQRSRLSKCKELVTSPVKTISRRLGNAFKNARERRCDFGVTKIIDATTEMPNLNAERIVISRTKINSQSTEVRLRELEPDVIITSGCPILKPRIFEIPRLATINVHWGIAPYYRGEDTLFWPLYLGDYDRIGVTIHQIDRGVDTGPIFAQGYPELVPGDTEVSVLAKCACLASDLLIETLAGLARGHSSTLMPTESGRLFLGRDRKIRHDLAYWVRRKLGRRPVPNVAPRTEFFIGPSPNERRDDD